MVQGLVIALAVSASLSTSKLGLVAAPNDPATDAVLTGANAPCPALAVFPLPATTAQATEYMTACPGGVAMAHVGADGLAVNAAVAVANMPAWLGLVPAGATFLEGPSEPTGAPSDVAAFWAAFARLTSADPRGLVPVVGAFPSGTTGASLACAVLDAVKAQQGAAAWRWSYHALSPGLTQDVATETPTTFGYRAIASACASAQAVPVVLSAAGPAGRGWSSADGSWLAFLDAQVQRDAFASGAALVAGIAPVQQALEAQLATPASPDGGATDGGADSGSASGGSVRPVPGVDGPLVPVHTSGGCASAPGAALIALAPLLLALRRRLRRQGTKR